MTARLLTCMPWCANVGCNGTEYLEDPDTAIMATADSGVPRPQEIKIGRIINAGKVELFTVTGLDGSTRIADLTLRQADQQLTALTAKIAQARAASSPSQLIAVADILLATSVRLETLGADRR